MSLVDRLRRVDPAWRVALLAFLIARSALTGWSLLIFLVFPTAVQNLDAFGTPVLAAFDLATSERYTYAREIDSATLSFKPGTSGNVIDLQTGSIWSLKRAQAIEGKYAGVSFRPSSYLPEDVFPYRGVASHSNMLLSLWQRFDTNWYLKIAQRGYAADDGSVAFFPLYPLLIKFLGLILLGNDLLAALLISSLAVIGVFYFVYRLADELAYPQAAARTVLYLAVFPTSFFLFAGYTESLFLVLALGSLDAAFRSRWAIAGLLAALAALTRLQGVLLIVPLLYVWWQRAKVSHAESPIAVKLRNALRQASPLVLIPISTGALFIWQYSSVDRAFLLTAYEGQLYARFVLPWENIAEAASLWTAGRASPIDILNLLATLLFATMTVIVWQRLPRVYGLYTLTMFLAPLFRMTTTQPLVSMLRYVLVLVPVFVMWGIWGRNVWVNRAVVYLSLPLALYASAQFILWGWVG